MLELPRNFEITSGPSFDPKGGKGENDHDRMSALLHEDAGDQRSSATVVYPLRGRTQGRSQEDGPCRLPAIRADRATTGFADRGTNGGGNRGPGSGQGAAGVTRVPASL